MTTTTEEDDADVVRDFLLITKLQSIHRFFGIVTLTVILAVSLIIGSHFFTTGMGPLKTYLWTVLKEIHVMGGALIRETETLVSRSGLTAEIVWFTLLGLIGFSLLVIGLCNFRAYLQEWSIARNLAKVDGFDAGPSVRLKTMNLILGLIVSALLLALVCLCIFFLLTLI
jgi:hypothetical protein